MPHEITNHSAILDAIGRSGIISELVEKDDGHFKYELDLEVIVYGRNYTGKKVGPYAHLLVYEAGEEIISQGDWGGNTFFIGVEGDLDVYVRDQSGQQKWVDKQKPGKSFGEMSVLAGVPRNATIMVPAGGRATVLKVERPALRLLRKLPTFGQTLDETYRRNGLRRTLDDVRQVAVDAFSPELTARLGEAAQFKIYSKHHVLFRAGEPCAHLFFIRNGWLKRVRDPSTDGGRASDAALDSEDEGADFFGAGNCLGLEGLDAERTWKHTTTLLARTEILEVAIAHIRADQNLRDTLLRLFSGADGEGQALQPELDRRAAQAVEKEISTGIIDGTNLLVMDMDLCVRCGNCSLACHKVHGQSRLLRRGIHIERPTRPGSSFTQHVLSPSVCLHCQDPECLTGCPTGAIGRFPHGQIDIDPKTCIGCGDCATQCPYNAISMIPLKPSAPPQPTPAGWSGRLKGWLSLAPPQLPPPVTEIENLLAVKCNLCENTPLNPAGARQPAYSCEENCPTGALVRVNPREYFGEAGKAIGIVYRDQTHAIGRNIHKSDPAARLWHACGILATIALTIATLWAARRYGLDGRLGETWLSVRWITGLVGLLGIAGVMAYPARKQVYRRRAGPLRYWMLAHVYLGVIAGVVLLLHGGRSTGGLLTSLLMVSFDLVILTGLFGIICYIVVPRIMTSIEGDPLLVEDLEMRRDELRAALAGIGAEDAPELRQVIDRRVRRRFLSLRYLLRQYVRREDLTDMLEEARREFEPEAERLSDAHARALLIEAIEAAATLRRVDSLVYLHKLLKVWLAPHVVSTSIMLALMVVHIIQVVYFAVR
jgi:Fe-S-cluster-containing dehydrogenase component/CRP-like cAMP-binding protein